MMNRQIKAAERQDDMTGNGIKDHSFAVLAYKESKYLEACIQSLLEQTSRDHVYISTSTPSPFISDIADKYGLDVYVNSAGGNIGRDWSFALKQARTKYVTLAHQDDIYFRDYAGKMVANAEKTGDAVIIFCDYVEKIDGEHKSHTLLLYVKRLLLWPFFINAGRVRSGFLKRLTLAFGSPICCPSVTFNKNLVNDFSFDETFKINLDWDAWIKFSRLKGSFIFIPERLMAHRIHPEAETSVGIKNNRRQTEDLIMFQRIWGKFIAKIIGLFYSLSYKINSDTSNRWK